MSRCKHRREKDGVRCYLAREHKGPHRFHKTCQKIVKVLGARFKCQLPDDHRGEHRVAFTVEKKPHPTVRIAWNEEDLKKDKVEVGKWKTGS